MLKKSGKFYADWEEGRGNRKRKAFPTRRAALAHQTAMRAEWQRKKARASARSPR